MSQIYYELDVSALMCHFQIKINDVEVFSLDIDGQTSADIPINQGILESGIQEIEVRVLPLSGHKELHKEAYVSYKVVEFDVSSGDFKFLKQWEKFQTPKVQKGIPFTIHKSTFPAKVTYKINAWQKGINLKEVKDLKAKLIIAYNKIISDINNGHYDKFVQACKNKEINVAKAMYLNEGEAANRIKKLTHDFSSGFKALPVPKDAIVVYSAYCKLVSLKRLNGMSALYLENDKTNEELVLPITFYIPEGKTEFEVI